VSVAGPVANLLLAWLCGFLIRIISPYDYPVVFYTLCFGLFVNAGLAVFNLLPIFPLDGSGILKGLVPRRVAILLSRWDRWVGLSLAVLLLVEHFAHIGILGRVLMLPIWTLVETLTQERFPLVGDVVFRALS
jgi:Zn-dependent protease